MAQDKNASDVKYEVGNVVIGKVKGYPPWPGEIIDPDAAPSKVKAERPVSKKVTFYCVRFFPVGDHAWLPSKDVSRLLPHEIASYISEPSKRKGELLEGYKIANEPHDWRKSKDALAQREKELAESGAAPDSGAGDHDELDDDDEEDAEEDTSSAGKKSKAKKRKRESVKESAEEKKGKRKRASEQLVKQRRGKGTKKSAENIESEDEEDKPQTEKPTSSKVADKERPNKRAKKDKESVAPAPAAPADEDGDDAAMANDPEAAKVKEWRHKLQRAFLTKTAPAAEEMAGLDTVFTTVEQYDNMTVEYLSYSKIGKVMRKIIQLTNIPSDEQYHFRQRAQALVTKWQQLISTSEDKAAPTSTKAGSAKASSVKPKSKSTKADEEDAPAELDRTNGVKANGVEGEAMEVDKS